MKKFTLIATLLAVSLGLNAQTQINLPITWDLSTVNYNTTPFGGSSTSQVTTDPVNSSNNALQFNKPVDAPVWAGVTLGDAATNGQLSSPIPFTSTATTISVKVYSPDAGITVRLKVEGGPGQQCETDQVTTVANAWETLVFDFTNNAIPVDPLNLSYTYQRLVIFFNFGVDGATVGAKTYYADSVYFGGTVVTPPPSNLDTIDLPITWDDTANIDYTTVPFEGGQSTADVDPTDPTNLVLKFTKPTGAQPWAGVTLGDQVLENPIPFTATEKVISVKLYSPAVGMPIMMKAEIQGGGGAAEAQDTTTVANQWETLTFDFDSPTAGTINPALNYNMLSFFGDFLVAASGQVFYIDSVYFGYPMPPAVDTHYVTFQVDMNSYTGTFTTPEVNGDFNGWCGNCNSMTDANLDGIWDVTLPITADSIEWKFAHDNWTGQENLTPGSACAKTTSGNTNRFMYLTGDTVLAPVCWALCGPCSSAPTTKNVTFQVDMAGYSGTFTTPEVNGDFNGWCGNCNAMTDANNDGIWEITLTIAADSIEWKYAHDNWTGQENLTQGDACTKTTSGFTNRFAHLSGDTTFAPVCWALCGPCQGNPPAQVNVTFKVDMSEVTEAYTTPELNGTFNGWCGSCTAMSDANNDDIWEVTVTLTEGDSIEYKFSADNWTIQETNDPTGACTNGNTQFTNRVLEVPSSDITLTEVCWGSCDICDTTIGVNEINASLFSVYPNPAKNLVTVSGLKGGSQSTITLVDMLGKTQYVSSTNSNSTVIETQNLANGVYFITVSNNAQMQTQRIVVSH